MIRPPRKGCQSREGPPADTIARGRAGRMLAAYTGWPERRRAHILPGSIAGSPCDGPIGRCYPLGPSAPGRCGKPGNPNDPGPGSALRPVADGHSEITRVPPAHRLRSLANATHPPSPRTTGPIERMDAKQVWRAALGELQVSLSPANFETWLRDTQLVDVEDNRFRISVPNGFAKDWLETRYRSLISQTLARIVGYSVQVEFVDRAGVGRGPAASGTTPSHRPARSPLPATGSQQVRVEPTRVGGEGGTTNINPRYTFSNFIVGSANRLAHAASLSVAERPGHAYNPLFLYGGVGLGQDPPDARDREPGDRQVPAQARRLRHEREVHERVHHLDPAGQDRRVPRPLPPDRPAPHRRHPVHRGQGADAGRVLPYVQRDPRGRQADRHVVRPAAEGDPDPRGAAAQPVRVGPHRRPDGAGPRDAHRDPARQGGGGRAARSRRTSSSSSRARS